MIPARSLPLFVLCALLLLPALGAAREMNAEESEAAVWQLEEAYWRYVKANDLDGYRTLWDERFVGWPGFAEHPVGKANITHTWQRRGDSWRIITGMSATYEH